jgi:hypothetical protein
MTINTMNSFAFRANGGYRGGVQAINKYGRSEMQYGKDMDMDYKGSHRTKNNSKLVPSGLTIDEY